MTFYAPPPPAPWHRAPVPARNPLATSGFVVALVGAVLALIPLVGTVSWLVSPTGLVLSIAGLAGASGRAGVGRGLAVAGIVLGAVGLLVCLIYTLVFTAAFSDGHQAATAPAAATDYTSSYVPPTYATPTAPALPTGTFADGTYLVGEELAPGTYRTTGADPDAIFQFCSAQRQDSDGRGIGWPETTNTGPALVTVRPSDGRVEFSGPCTWTLRR